MGRNHWIYPALYEKIEIIDRFVQSHAISPGFAEDALQSIFPECFWLRAADWAFMMHAESNNLMLKRDTCTHREHDLSLSQISQNAVDSGWPTTYKTRTNIHECRYS